MARLPSATAAAQSFFLEADFAFLSARFSFKDLAAAVFALDFFGDLSAMATTPQRSSVGSGEATLRLSA